MPFSILWLTLSGILWGTGGLFGSMLGKTAGLSPLSVAALRLLAGGALIVILLVVTGRRWPAGRAPWTRIIVTGLLSALFQACYFAAISLTGVSLATLVTIGGTPVIVAVVERITRRRILGRSGVITVVAALAGLGLLVGFPDGGLSEAAMLGGTGLSLVSAAGFAAVTLIGGLPVPGVDDLAVNGYGFLFGGVILLPLAVGTGFGLRPGLNGGSALEAAGWLLALGLWPTAVAYVLYYRGLRTAPASTAALLSLLEPLTAAVLAAVFLGDRLSVPGVVGAVILLAAVVRAAIGHGGGPELAG
jgi:DME family drug/metabolite transporter